MAAKRYIELVSGKFQTKQATVVSTGAPNDGDLVALDSSGKLDVSVLPVGVGPDVKLVVTSETLAAGDYVSFWDNLGTENVRLADNSNGRAAHGFVKAAFSAAATATVYFEGPNDDLSGLTPGERQYLGTSGAVLSTPLDPDVATGSIHQLLGIACDATTVNTDIADCVQL